MATAPISHTTQLAGVDSADGKISKDAWNADHTITFAGAGSISASAPGDTAAAGNTGLIPDAGHVHARSETPHLAITRVLASQRFV